MLLLNFRRIMWFFWGLGPMLFNITKDTFFAEILAFSNIFGFSVVNSTPKWTKTETLGAFHLSQNSKFWRIFQTICLSYWRLHLVKVSARSNNIWPKKRPWMLNQYLNLNFTTTYGTIGYSWKKIERAWGHTFLKTLWNF